jgi:hypothetical protein
VPASVVPPALGRVVEPLRSACELCERAIFVCSQRQDMRRSFDALALAVKERLELDP